MEKVEKNILKHLKRCVEKIERQECQNDYFSKSYNIIFYLDYV